MGFFREMRQGADVDAGDEREGGREGGVGERERTRARAREREREQESEREQMRKQVKAHVFKRLALTPHPASPHPRTSTAKPR